MSTPLAPDVPSPSTFGPKMVNHDLVIDPETDLDAVHFNRIRAQLAAISATSIKAWATVVATAGTATLAEHGAVWDETGAPPTVTRQSAGVVDITWPATVLDLQDPPEQHAVVLRSCQVTGFAASAFSHQALLTPGTRTVTVNSYNEFGADADPLRLYVVVL